MAFDRDSFGPYLRHARERRNITLDAIAARTKIARSLLAKLERGDLADWPSGIFRRSFFREYVAAIGLEPDALLDEFLRLFPDPASDVRPAAPADLRLTLDAAPRAYVPRGGVRRALIDTGAIALVATAIALVTGHAAVVIAAVAITYHAVAIVMAGSGSPVRSAARVATAADEQALATAHDARTRPDSRRGDHARRAIRGRRRGVESGVVRKFPQPS